LQVQVTGAAAAINLNSGLVQLNAAASASAVTVNGGTLEIGAAGAVAGPITLNAGTLQLDGVASASTGPITFAGPNATLLLEPGAHGLVLPTQTLAGFAPGDQIVLQGSQYALDSLAFDRSAGKLELVNSSGGIDLSFQLSNSSSVAGYFTKQASPNYQGVTPQTTISYHAFDLGNGTDFDAAFDSGGGINFVPASQIQWPDGVSPFAAASFEATRFPRSPRSRSTSRRLPARRRLSMAASSAPRSTRFPAQGP
jgi:hypothetical protein